MLKLAEDTLTSQITNVTEPMVWRRVALVAWTLAAIVAALLILLQVKRNIHSMGVDSMGAYVFRWACHWLVLLLRLASTRQANRQGTDHLSGIYEIVRWP